MTTRGYTIYEVLVSIVMLGILASVTTLAFRRFTPPDPNDPTTVIADSTPVVMLRGKPLTIEFSVDSQRVAATLYPDGSVVADTLLRVNRLTGRSADAR